MQFDVSLVSTLSDDIKQSAIRMKENVNTPNELQAEIQKLESHINSLKSLTLSVNAAGTNAQTVQYIPDQNQT